MKKQKKPLNSVALLFFMIIAAAILTYLIPAGSYERMEVEGRMVVDPDSFTWRESSPAGLLDIFVAVPSGMTEAANLLVLAMLIGGGMECVQASGALNIGISRVIKKVGLARGNFILVVLFYIFAFLGGFLGFIEGALPFIPIAISIAIGLGYDSVVGVAIAMVGSIMGFACGPTNAYTVGVSQSIAGLPIYSGIELRLVVFAIVPLICLVYILNYAGRVKKNPTVSLVADVDVSDLAFDTSEFESQPFTWKHGCILFTLIGSIASYVYGTVALGWGFAHLGAMFVIVGMISGGINGLGVNGTAETFLRGAKSMAEAGIVMGVAFGISWVLTEACILDTIVYYMAGMLAGLSPVVSIIALFVVVMFINLLIPSGSGKAVVVMPIILPIAQIVGIESQVAILAYQFGDGVTKMCTPLLGVLLLALGFGRVPFSKWAKFVFPLVGILVIVSCAVLVVAMKIGYC
ncbi:MAG: YfcC family protein [Lachnospiraceae bacterium]|nr:YfcC family protein [Lachnospiraceae bacterium]